MLSTSNPDASKPTGHKPLITHASALASSEGLHQGVDQWVQGWRIKIAGASLDPDLYSCSQQGRKPLDERPAPAPAPRRCATALVVERESVAGKGKGEAADEDLDAPRLAAGASNCAQQGQEARADGGQVSEPAGVIAAAGSCTGNGKRFCASCGCVHHYRSKCSGVLQEPDALLQEPDALLQQTDALLAPDPPPCVEPPAPASDVKILDSGQPAIATSELPLQPLL